MEQQPVGTSDPRLLAEASWSVEELATEYAPEWANRNKIAIAKLASPGGTRHAGTVVVSRWADGGLPETLSACRVSQRAGFFRYEIPDTADATTHWHMNFADPHLFGYGEGGLLAQDELQVTEHPCLASLGKAIEAGRHGQRELKRLTVEGGRATPVLVEGAPRRCALDTSHIYGDRFAQASVQDVLAATTVLEPATISNILALAALPARWGDYTADQVRSLLVTAFAGFRSVVLRSGSVTLHTGHWGCGAFGGNKGLVAAVQLLAAGAAGVDRVCFWWGHTALDESALQHAILVAQHLDGARSDEVVTRLVAARYRWGDANENHVPYEPPANCMLGP